MFKENINKATKSFDLSYYDKLYKEKFDFAHNELRIKVRETTNIFDKLKIIDNFYKNAQKTLHQEILDDYKCLVSLEINESIFEDFKQLNPFFYHQLHTIKIVKFDNEKHQIALKISEDKYEKERFKEYSNSYKTFELYIISTLKEYLKEISQIDWDIEFYYTKESCDG